VNGRGDPVAQPDRDVSGAVREAAAVKVVELAAACAMVIVAVVMQVAQRRASDPDFTRTWRMRAAKQAERGWACAAGWAWRRAEQFRVEYEDLADGD
jgi:hypothetical protein